MKKLSIFLLVLMLAVFHITGFAQGREGKRQQLHELRKNVYARELALTDEEAKKFWPVFEKMEEEMRAVRKQMRAEHRRVMENFASLTDADLDKSMQTMMDFEQKQLDIKKKYYGEFKKILPMKKVVLIHKAEREFKKEVLNRYRDKPDDEE